VIRGGRTATLAWASSAFVCAVLGLILSGGRERARAADNRGWLGIYHEPAALPGSLAGYEGDTASVRAARSGLRVTAVWPDSPAERGGLLVGDIIVGAQGRLFDCPPESTGARYARATAALASGDRLDLRVLRDGVEREATQDGRALPPEFEREFWRRPSDVLDSLRAGETIVARAGRRRGVEALTIILGLRPEARWGPGKSADDIYPSERYPESAFAEAVSVIVDEQGWRADTEDLRQRLARCHDTADPHRLDCVTYAHREPFRLESLAEDLTTRFHAAPGPREVIAEARRILVPGVDAGQSAGSAGVSSGGAKGARSDGAGPAASPGSEAASSRGSESASAPGSEAASSRGTDAASRPAPRSRAEREAMIDPLVEEISAALGEAAALHARAFAAFSPEERRFLEERRFDLSDAFAGEVYIHFDEDRGRFVRNRRILELAGKIDYASLLAAADRLAALADPAWARAAAELARSAYGDTLFADILFDRSTEHGRILIAGAGPRWHRETDVAFLLDLGGDDFYTGNAGGSSAWGVPVAIAIDASGNDAYESTLKSCQGAGCLGVGALLDLDGDDTYIGIQWCQGIGYAGVGWLHDLAGDDTYRGRTFCQGVGLFGAGFLLDASGSDRFEGDCQVQGVGLARGVGALLDRGGDDRYYAKGLYPTGYGDAGIFDAWSQGCGIGFRTLASGGLGLLLDGGGADRMEAGNFSQGGGYYYGLGLLRAFADGEDAGSRLRDARDRRSARDGAGASGAGGRPVAGGEGDAERGRPVPGPDDDVYIGSRYNQGFCAHQAAGVFLEDGGDDFYTTRQAVAQGLAWDECVTLFIDRRGDDVYQGGGGFSQGASAHNAICVFLDQGGRDAYDYVPGQALAGGNDYHGGTSLSVFVDEGGGEDRYASAASGNGAIRTRAQHGLFLDLPGRIDRAGRDRDWRSLRRIE